MDFLRFIVSAYPRAPGRAGILMRIYFLWQENFTAAGHAAFALMFFAVFAGLVPGFWAAWIFSGFVFIFFLSLVPSLFLTSKKTFFEVESVNVKNAVEGGSAELEVTFKALSPVDFVELYCFRMDSAKFVQHAESLSRLECGSVNTIRVRLDVGEDSRGMYPVSKVGLAVPEIKGMLRHVFTAGEAQVLVYPRPACILDFPFLTAGAGGQVFAPLLLPQFGRGMDFAGVREYREGDSLRDLHHKAFARYGRPFTKEFESERGAGAVLVVDVSARSLREDFCREPLIRLAAGIGRWLIERQALGRLFVGDDEIPLSAGGEWDCLVEALARIPRVSLARRRVAVHEWSPAARPMGPVLRLGLHPSADSLVHKHVVVGANPGLNAGVKPGLNANLSASLNANLNANLNASKLSGTAGDTLFVDAESISSGEVSL